MKFVAFGLILGYSSLLAAAAPAATSEKERDQKLRGAHPDAQRKLWAPYCPHGEGWYCGVVMPHLDPHTLYYCQDGHYYEKDDCAASPGGECHVPSVHEDDYCVTPHPDPDPYPWCPSGPGKYCGSHPDVPEHLDDHTLYYCKHGHYKVVTDCYEEYSGDCKVTGPGHWDYCEVPSHPPPHHPDPYPRCPFGNGYYCGDSLDVPTELELEKEIVYKCFKGHYEPFHNCEDYGKVCYEADPGVPDSCKPTSPGTSPTPSCPYHEDEGLYCGSNPHTPGHLEDDTLYYCKNGHYTPKYDCLYYHKVCEVGDYHTEDYCVVPDTPHDPPASCTPGHYYCGDKDLHQDPDIIYKCDGHGYYWFYEACTGTCEDDWGSVKCSEEHRP
mmetsp:Transcript_25618/g.57036  ORF Transcript_25618/g.57036 Transcript_25618/m.57036 type:complete len:382 (+) Transcript_25618:245-1390(+)